MYRCPNCGGDMTFSPEKQKLVCAYCDSEFTVDEFEAKKDVHADEHRNDFEPDPSDKYYQATVFTCPQCGGELISMSDTAATFCSFCGASVLLQSRVSNEMKPDIIIPFKKSKQECAAQYKKMLARSLFIPSSMKKDTEIEKFRSIYMPYWVYSYAYEGKLQVPGKTSKRRGDYIYTKHYTFSSHAQMDYEGISYDASSSFADNLSQAVAPFDIKEADSFKAAYMTGHYADTKDIDADVYEEDARQVVAKDAAKRLISLGDYSAYDISESDIKDRIDPEAEKIKLGFFPVWFLASRSKKGDRVSYAVMNGQTGKVAADLPVDYLKYLIGSVLLAIPIYLLLTFVLNFTFTPRAMLGISLILGLISLVIANGQMNRVYTRENNLDDKGFQALQGQRTINKTKTIKTKSGKDVVFSLRSLLTGVSWFWVIFGGLFLFSKLGPYVVVAAIIVFVIVIAVPSAKANKKEAGKDEVYPAPFSEKWKIYLKPVIGIILSLVVFVMNPFEDLIPYSAAVVSLALIAWTFFDIVKAHNRLTMRKLPQLGARGGDENA